MRALERRRGQAGRLHGLGATTQLPGAHDTLGVAAAQHAPAHLVTTTGTTFSTGNLLGRLLESWRGAFVSAVGSPLAAPREPERSHGGGRSQPAGTGRATRASHAYA